MENGGFIGQNIARLRLDRELSQDEIASKAGISRLALGKIERGEVIPKVGTLQALASALGTSVADLITVVRPLESVRFRSPKVKGREQILAEVSRWLQGYCWLEKELHKEQTFTMASLRGSSRAPAELAKRARDLLKIGAEPIRDICGLLEQNGVKVLLLKKKSDAFFGLSVAEKDGGPAVVVNTWERISVERWIFTAAHELGHLLLHLHEYQRQESDEPKQAEREADTFASHFLMPEKTFASEWDESYGHPLIRRVLKVKRIFGVSYKTVLYRLVETKRVGPEVWGLFQAQHLRHFGKTLSKTDEPSKLDATEFAWNWSRAGEPAGLSDVDFLEDRLYRLTRIGLDQSVISLGRAAEILRLSRDDMRRLAADWAA